MQTENLTEIFRTFAHLNEAPDDFKNGLTSLINQTGSHVTELTVGDLIKLSAAQIAAYRPKPQPQPTPEQLLNQGKGTIEEQTAAISLILSNRANKYKIPRYALDNAVAKAKTALDDGKSGYAALHAGDQVLLDAIVPVQAA